jgi:hypothetical protein
LLFLENSTHMPRRKWKINIQQEYDSADSDDSEAETPAYEVEIGDIDDLDSPDYYVPMLR